MKKVKVLHLCSGIVFAKRFVLPMTQHLQKNPRLTVELWVEKDKNSVLFTKKDSIIYTDLQWALSYQIFSIQKILSLFKALKEFKPDILHAHTTRASLVPLLLAKILKIPVRIYHNHGFPYLGYTGISRFFLRLIEKINISLSTHCIGVSIHNVQAAQEDGLTEWEKKGSIIANGSTAGIDLEEEFNSEKFNDNTKEKARLEYHIPNHAYVIAYIGRPHRRKGFHFLLKTWEESLLWKQSENFLFIAGCSLDECYKIIPSTVGNIIAYPYIKNMPLFFNACDIVVLPSFHEGLSYALLEAAAAYKACVAFNIVGNQSVIDHEKTGYLTPPGNKEAFIKVCLDLKKNIPLRTDLGKNARKKVESHFDRKKYLTTFNAYYKKLILGIAG